MADVELRLEPSSDRFDPLDDRWLDQVATLVTELDREVGGVEQERGQVEGGKGFDIAAIVLSLGSAGVLSGAIEVVRSWLSRDRSRSLKVSWSDAGEVQAIELNGSDLDDPAFDEILRTVSVRLAGQQP